MSTTRQDYIECAIVVLNDAQNTSNSKSVARDILRNAGFSEREINEFESAQFQQTLAVMAA